jgi:hypothetical protein
VSPGITAQNEKGNGMKIKMTQYMLGKKSLQILRIKMRKKGLNVGPELNDEIDKLTEYIGYPREEIVDFINKFILPEVKIGGGLSQDVPEIEPTEREAFLAYRYLKIKFFWNAGGLRQECQSIADKIPVSFEEVSAIALYILQKHLRDQFGGTDTRNSLEVIGERPDDENIDVAEVR